MKTSGRKQDRTRYPLPDPIDDTSRICVKLFIPNIPGHREAFLGAIYNLTRWYAWQQDEDKQAIEAATVWKGIFNDLIENMWDNCDEEIPCLTFTPDAPFIEWFPNNPYTEPDLITDGYNSPAWYQATAASNLILGTQTGDIVTDLSRFPPGSLPTIIPASGLPRFRINLIAPGRVTIHLLNIFAGSLAQITIDDDISTLRFIDMDRDQLAAPFETATTTPVEVEVTGTGSHHIDVIVVSQINDQIPFLHHGGGLRKVEICSGAIDMPYFELRQSPTDPCQLEQRQSSTGEWSLAFDYSLCDSLTRPDTPDQSRYSADGILEVSYDDGATFEEARDLDPRFNSPLLPPLTSTEGETRRCEAANNVVGFMQDMANNTAGNVSAFATITGLIGALAGIIVAIISGGAAIPLLIGLAGALFAAGQAAFSAAMTSAVYETLLCIVYCETPDNGTYSEANWQAIKARILAELTGIAATFLHDNINAFGPAGLNNAARAGINAGLECDECDCGVVCAEWSVANFGAEPACGTYLGTFDGYERYESTLDVTTNTQILTIMTPTTADCCELIDFHVITDPDPIYAVYRLDCGAERSGGNLIGAWTLLSCVQYLSAQRFTGAGGDPFVVEFLFGECP